MVPQRRPDQGRGDRRSRSEGVGVIRRRAELLNQATHTSAIGCRVEAPTLQPAARRSSVRRRRYLRQFGRL